MSNITNITTPVGRIVSGDCWKPRTTDGNGMPLIVKSGPNAGQPRVEYYIGLAIPKNSPEWHTVKALIEGEARQSFPHLFGANGECLKPDFSFKIADGDSVIPNAKGRRNCDRAGWPGHWILNFSTGLQPKCVTDQGRTVLTDPTSIKRGYFAQVYGSVKGNGQAQKPGVYLNLSLINFIGYGEEITSGPDAAEIFAASPVLNNPQGMTNIPPTPRTTIATVVPAPDFVNGPAPYVPATPTLYTTADGKWTKTQLLQAGYTDAMINALPHS